MDAKINKKGFFPSMKLSRHGIGVFDQNETFLWPLYIYGSNRFPKSSVRSVVQII